MSDKLKLRQFQRILAALTKQPRTTEQLDEADQALFKSVVAATYASPPPEKVPGIKSIYLRFWLADDASLKADTALVQYLDANVNRIEELVSKRPPTSGIFVRGLRMTQKLAKRNKKPFPDSLQHAILQMTSPEIDAVRQQCKNDVEQSRLRVIADGKKEAGKNRRPSWVIKKIRRLRIKKYVQSRPPNLTHEEALLLLQYPHNKEGTEWLHEHFFANETL